MDKNNKKIKPIDLETSTWREIVDASVWWQELQSPDFVISPKCDGDSKFRRFPPLPLPLNVFETVIRESLSYRDVLWACSSVSVDEAMSPKCSMVMHYFSDFIEKKHGNQSMIYFLTMPTCRNFATGHWSGTTDENYLKLVQRFKKSNLIGE